MTQTNDLVKAISILLVEDNPGDAELARIALSESKMKNKLNIVSDGEEAMEFLFKKGQYKDAPRPDLILLDLNLPKKDGREVLNEIKSDPKLKSIPVVILTTSSEEADIIKTYSMHANCYITKPLDIEKFFGVVHQIESFWMSIVVLPNGE